MANPSGDKGYRGEAPVLAYLRSRGFRHAYRLRSQGVNDKGDIGNIFDCVIEIKNAAKYEIGMWMTETIKEKARAGARTAALIVKPRTVGDTRIKEWWAILTLEDYVQLLIDAGYGPYEEPDDDDHREARLHADVLLHGGGGPRHQGDWSR